MRIGDAQLSLTSSHQQSVSETRESRLESWVGARPAATGAGDSFQRGSAGTAQQSLFDQLAAMSREMAKRTMSASAAAVVADPSGQEAATESQMDPETRKILTILEKVFGMKDATRFVLKGMQATDSIRTAGSEAAQLTQQAGGQERQGWGVSYDYSATYHEVEDAALKIEGVIELADGTQFAVSLDYRMHREVFRSEEMHLRLGDAALTDPLALDLDGTGLGFTATPLAVDLDGDGQVDRPKALAGGNRYLALDRDGDGRISQGSELFGPRTGNGFAELARLDSDGNGWIDSNDLAFSQLLLWNGGRTESLAERGVGAIALANTDLPFEHRAADGGLVAQNRRGGLYLGTDGRAGGVMQVDLVA